MKSLIKGSLIKGSHLACLQILTASNLNRKREVAADVRDLFSCYDFLSCFGFSLIANCRMLFLFYFSVQHQSDDPM